MGGSNWSTDYYAGQSATRTANGISGVTNTYTAAVSSGTVARAIHKTLDPKGVKLRESRDSDAHPTSNAIVVVFDQTGSMGEIPAILQTKLGSLMSILLKKGYIEHPQIMFAAIGDSRTEPNEVAPLQIGQWESGGEMDDDLDRIYLEGNGGGQQHESYELAMYFLAKHTEMDCLSKRGKKGYVFLIGDEKPYPTIRAKDVERILGYKIEADIPLNEIVEELKEKFEVFFILPSHSQYRTRFKPEWQKLFGENTLILERPEAVAEVIALAVGLNEQTIDIDDGTQDLKDNGSDAASINAATKALVPYSKTKSLMKTGTISGHLAEL